MPFDDVAGKGRLQGCKAASLANAASLILAMNERRRRGMGGTTSPSRGPWGIHSTPSSRSAVGEGGLERLDRTRCKDDASGPDW